MSACSWIDAMCVACLASPKHGRATGDLDLTLGAECVGVSHLPVARTERMGMCSLILSSLPPAGSVCQHL